MSDWIYKRCGTKWRSRNSKIWLDSLYHIKVFDCWPCGRNSKRVVSSLSDFLWAAGISNITFQSTKKRSLGGLELRFNHIAKWPSQYKRPWCSRSHEGVVIRRFIKVGARQCEFKQYRYCKWSAVHRRPWHFTISVGDLGPLGAAELMQSPLL